MLALIGGSGMYELAGLAATRRIDASTPYGAPSARLVAGELKARAVLFLARHGEQHRLPPHRINYRANIRALRDHGATHIVAVATVGGVGAVFAPGVIALPDQILDYTSGRENTFFDGGQDGEGGVKHIDFTHPYDETLRARLRLAARRANETVHFGGTYAVTQGPRLETAAEIRRIRRDGADVVGMTGMPEAVLARELDLPYAALTVVVNAAAGTGASGRTIDLAAAEVLARVAMGRIERILEEVVTDGG
jgi:5'-methylthioinosine phosphorylase